MKAKVSRRIRMTTGAIRDDEARDLRFKQQERINDGIWMVALGIVGVIVAGFVMFVAWVTS